MPLFKLYHPDNIYGKFAVSAFVASLIAVTAIMFAETWSVFFKDIFAKVTDGIPGKKKKPPKNLIFATSILSTFITTFILTLCIYIFLHFLIGYTV